MQTVGEIIRWRARQHPDACAVWFQGRETSYAELDRRANRAANALIAAGLQPGQRVAVLDKGHDELIELMLGVAKAGGVYTPINWRLAPPEIAFVLNDAEAPLVFVGEDFRDAVIAVESELRHVRQIVHWGSGAVGWRAYRDFVGAATGDDPRRDSCEDETVWQLYTSGTTGHPKGAELTHINLCATVQMGISAFGGVLPGDVGLVCMPLYHIGGSGYALSLLFGGAKLVITREANPGEILELIASQRINFAFMVPALFNFLIQHPRCKDTDFSSLKALLYGASPIPEDLLKSSLATFGCDLVQAYGLTETTGAIVILPARDHVVGSPRLRACGLPTFGTGLRIVDDKGRELPAGQVGEILIKGPAVMKGYWQRPEATASTIRDGWFHSGDAGYLDADGYLYIHDRVKDMIVSGAENIYPAEVESVLFGHEDVADVAVVGVPDDRWGEAVKAVVVRRAGSNVTADELIRFCDGKLAGYKRPKSVDFVDALPRNPTGKILKRELRDRYWQGRDRKVN